MRTTNAIINVDHLAWNLQVIRRRANGAGVLAMIKANAYGHGLTGTARALQALQIDMLGVAFVHEAEALRRNGITTPILVVTPTQPEDAPLIAQHDLEVVVCDLREAAPLSEAAAAGGRQIRVHLSVDTGMHRDGVSPHDAVPVLQALKSMPGLTVVGLCTHFATAYEESSPYLREQLETFDRVRRQCLDTGHAFEVVHAANSGAIWHAHEAHFNLVRPGLSLYGYGPTPEVDPLLRPVMSLTTRVSAVRRIWPGDTVSYGRTFMASESTTIATIPIGYGDGYLRALSGKTTCLIHGKEYPIVGIICMDACMVDMGDDPVEVGDDVVLIGSQADAEGHVRSIDAAQVAQRAGTITYEITTAISERVPRTFVGDLAQVAGDHEVHRV